MPQTEAAIGYGTIFEIGDDSSPPDYTALGEVTSVTPPSDTVDMVDATHYQSPGRMREFIAGLIDPGECSLEMNFIAGSASEQIILDLKASGARAPCRLTFPNGATRTFDALIMTYQAAIPLDNKMTATVGLRVTGPVVAEGPDSP